MLTGVNKYSFVHLPEREGACSKRESTASTTRSSHHQTVSGLYDSRSPNSMPTASSARLLAAVETFKNNDSLLFSSKHSKSGNSHGQPGTAAGRVQQAASAAGSLSSSKGSSKWGSWPSAVTSAHPPSSAVDTTGLKAATSGSQLASGSTSGFTIKARVTTTPFDAAGFTSSTTVSRNPGLRSSSAPRNSCAASLEGPNSPGQAPGSSTFRVLSPTKASLTGPASTTRSSSTGRSIRASGSSTGAAAGSIGAFSSPAGIGLQASRSGSGPYSSSSSFKPAVPGRARVLQGPAAESPSSRSAAPSTRPRASATYLDDIGNARLGRPGAPGSRSPDRSSRVRGTMDSMAAAPRPASPSVAQTVISSSTRMRRSASLERPGATGSLKAQQQEQQGQPAPSEGVSGAASHRPRAPDAAARQGRTSRRADASVSPAADGAGSAGAAVGSSVQPSGGGTQLASSGSSYLARLHLQRAATADAVSRVGTCSAASSSGDAAATATAGRRVNSASAVNSSGSSGRQQALEQLRAGRTRARAVAAPGDAGDLLGSGGAVVRPQATAIKADSSSTGLTGASSGRSLAAGAHAASAPGSGMAPAGNSTGSSKHSPPQVQRQASSHMDSAVASLTALLEKLNRQKQQLSMSMAADAQPLGQQQQQAQQQTPQPHRAQLHHGQQQLDGQQHVGAQQGLQRHQQQQDHSNSSSVQQGRAPCIADGDSAGPGERLEFPSLQPVEPPTPRSTSGSYLDIIRRGSRGSSKQPQPQAQHQQDPQAHHQQQHHQHHQQQQQQREGQSALQPCEPLHLQYHPSMFQQQQQQYQAGPPPPQQQQYEPPPDPHLQRHHRTESLGREGPGTQQHGLSGWTAPHQEPSSRSSIPSSRSSSYSSSIGGSGSTTLYRPPYAPPQQAAPTASRDQGGSSKAGAWPAAQLATAAPSATAAAPDNIKQHGGAGWNGSSSSSSGAPVAGYHQHALQQQQAARQQLLQPAHQQQPMQQLQQPKKQQQQLALSPEGVYSSYSSSPDQHGFLIGTQPMPENSTDTGQGLSSITGAPGSSRAVDAVHQTAADAAARRAFFSCSTASSSAGSDDLTAGGMAAAAAAEGCHAGRQGDTCCMLGQGNLQQLQLGSTAAPWRDRASSSDAAAAPGHPLASQRDSSSRPDAWPPRGAVQVTAAVMSYVDDSSDADTDVSEMSSSLNGVASSSGSSVDVDVQVHSRRVSDAATPQYPQDRRSSTVQPALHSSAINSMQYGRIAQGSTPRGAVQGYGAASAEGAATVAAAAAAGAVGCEVTLKACARSVSRRGLVGVVPPRGCCGIRNLGNTCYQNSCVQLLGCVPEFVGALLGRQALLLFKQAAADAANNGSRRSIQQALAAAAAAAAVGIEWVSNATVGPALQALLCEMVGFQQQCQQQQQQLVHRQQQLYRVTDCMDELRSAMADIDPRWDDGEQWDVSEAITQLLQIVHNESNRVRGRPQYRELKLHGCEAQQAAEAAAYAKSWEDSVVLDIFSWQLQSTMTCCSCGKRSHAFDSAQELLVAIPPGGDDVSLQECLSRTIFSPEKMRGEEGYKCESCKAVREATKQLQLFTYPQVLLLGLKRFETRGGSKGGHKGAETYTSRKVSTRVRVDARDVLDLSGFCNPAGLQAAAAAGKPPPRYELIAVADHSGCINGGHYTARGRCLLDGSWAEFNDSLVLPTEPPLGSSSEAYMMLYRLIDCDLGY